MGTIGSIAILIFAALIAMAPILFAAWAFSNAFQVQNYIKLLKQITVELQRLNDYNESEQRERS